MTRLSPTERTELRKRILARFPDVAADLTEKLAARQADEADASVPRMAVPRRRGPVIAAYSESLECSYCGRF